MWSGLLFVEAGTADACFRRNKIIEELVSTLCCPRHAHLGVATTNCYSTPSHLVRPPQRMFPRGSLALKIPVEVCRKERLRCFASSARSAARSKGSHYDALMLPKNATKQQVKAKFYEVRVHNELQI